MKAASQELNDALVKRRSELSKALFSTRTKANYRRTLCLWLRLSLNLTAPEIGLALGLTSGTVRRVQSDFHKFGFQKLLGKGSGGPHHRCLSQQEETDLMAKYRKRARYGASLNVKAIHSEVERRSGRKISVSTIYRMLARHGCRKMLPRVRSKNQRKP